MGMMLDRNNGRIHARQRWSGPLLCITSIAMFSSCAFDHRFLAPETIPAKAKQAMFIDPVRKDTTYLVLAGLDAQPAFMDARMRPMELPYTIESVAFPASDKRLLNGWLMKPLGQAARMSTILFLHGNGGNITTEYRAVVPLVERGFPLFLFDYGGYGLSTGEVARRYLLSDAQAALAYMRGRADQQGRKIVVYGQSLGGHTAVLLAAKAGDAISALVTEGAFSGFDDIAAKTTGLGVIARIATANSTTAKKAITEVRVPLLIIHSTEDKVVPYAMAEQLFASANEPKELYTVSGRHCNAPLLFADSLVKKIERLTEWAAPHPKQ